MSVRSTISKVIKLAKRRLCACALPPATLAQRAASWVQRRLAAFFPGNLIIHKTKHTHTFTHTRSDIHVCMCVCAVCMRKIRWPQFSAWLLRVVFALSTSLLQSAWPGNTLHVCCCCRCCCLWRHHGIWQRTSTRNLLLLLLLGSRTSCNCSSR